MNKDRDRCESCRWWDESKVLDGGYCRVDSPRPSAEGYAVWPLTSSGDWCGRFERGAG